MSDNRQLLLEKGWRRHTFLSTENGAVDLISVLPEKLHETLQVAGVKVLIATYDCAVVYDSFDDEPWLQLLIAIPVDFNKQFSSGRNARRLHFFIESDEGALAYEVNAKSICQIDRELLKKLDRDESVRVTLENSYDLRNWLAERYRQDTWPDAFNSAVEPATKRLKRFWKRYQEYITGLYIKLNTYDEIEAGKYKAAIIICIESEKMRALIKCLRETDKSLINKSISEVKNKVVNEIKNAFGDTIEYEVDPTSLSGYAIEVLGEDSVTIDQLRKFPRYSPFSMSLYGDAPLPVEMLPGKGTKG